MSYRRFVLTAALAAIVVWLSQPPAAAQARPSSAKGKATAEAWNPPRTPDGQPDLQGFWTNATTTPLERPTEFAGKQVLTEQEAAEFQDRVLRPSGEGPPGLQAGSSIDDFWFERGHVVAGRRSSLIVDPPDGRIPPDAGGAGTSCRARTGEEAAPR